MNKTIKDMNLRIVKKYDELHSYDTVIIPFNFGLKVLSEKLGKFKGIIEEKVINNNFCGKAQEIYYYSIKESQIINVILIGLGKEDEVDNSGVFLSFSKAFSKCKELNSKNVIVLLDNINDEIKNHQNLEKIFESCYFSNYKFDKYKNNIIENTIETVDFVCEDGNAKKALIEAKYCAYGTMLARDLINEPPANMTPNILGEEAQKIGNECGFKVTVYDKEEIEKMGMNTFLAVGKGADNSPTLIVMEYLGDPYSQRKIGLIGKGVTFDTGGYSLKSEKSMENMHGDMAGAAAVIGSMKIITKMKLRVNVVSVIAACENRVSANAYLPGDIIKSMSGKYIEINNTDSEGRLTMADAITFLIENHKVDKIIDIATLTDSVQAALGNKTAGVFTNDDEFRRVVKKASIMSCEKIWELPCDEDLKVVLKSDFADLKNSAYGSEAGGGAIVAALFLKEFVQDLPWIHIDIGGTSWTTENLDYCPKGGLGFGTRLLYSIVKEIY